MSENTKPDICKIKISTFSNIRSNIVLRGDNLYLVPYDKDNQANKVTGIIVSTE